MISPELHRYFDMNANVGQNIASGFFDSMSLFQKLSFVQQQQLELPKKLSHKLVLENGKVKINSLFGLLNIKELRT